MAHRSCLGHTLGHGQEVTRERDKRESGGRV